MACVLNNWYLPRYMSASNFSMFAIWIKRPLTSWLLIAMNITLDTRTYFGQYLSRVAKKNNNNILVHVYYNIIIYIDCIIFLYNIMYQLNTKYILSKLLSKLQNADNNHTISVISKQWSMFIRVHTMPLSIYLIIYPRYWFS